MVVFYDAFLLMQNLNHQNIVKYLGSVKTETHLHIILEYDIFFNDSSMINQLSIVSSLNALLIWRCSYWPQVCGERLTCKHH